MGEGNAMSEDRYSRQTAVPQVGDDGQARLASARVLVVGVGGLGCPALLYLAGAGIGRLRLVDADRVSESNLHRQTLFAQADIGRFKVEAAAERLSGLNPTLVYEPHAMALTDARADALVAGCDVVLDAADSYLVSCALSDACTRAGIPLVSASMLGMEGSIGVFCDRAPGYRAVFPEFPAPASCASAGVLGPAVGMLGAWMAQLAMHLVIDYPPEPRGRLWRADLGAGRFVPISFIGASEDGLPPRPLLLSPEDILPADLIVDLRSAVEREALPCAGAIAATADALPVLPPGARLVLACASGRRALAAAERVLKADQNHNLAVLALGVPA
jgi:molybdopterin/thiamine biosynthesis adenylyltransferase/rhodanese-related sulfurtransferase